MGEDICSLGPTVWENPDYYWITKSMVVTGDDHTGGAFLCESGVSFCMQLGQNSGRHTVAFDDIGVAMMSIFQVMTLEGWADLCYEIQDAVGYWHWLYFVLLIMIGPMFAMQLFLVVIATSHAELTANKEEEEVPAEEEQEKGEGNKVAPEPLNGFVSEESNVDMLGKTERRERSAAQNFRFKLKLFAKSESLSNLVMAVILLSTALMATEGLCEFDPNDCAILQGCLFSGPACGRFKGTLEFINLVFTLIFCFELAVKVLGLGFMKFFRGPESGMNIFDAIIVAASVIEFQGGVDAGQCYFDYFHGPATEILSTNWGGKNLGRLVTVRDMFGADGVMAVVEIPDMEISPAWKESLMVMPRILQDESGGWMYNPGMYNFCSAGGAFAVLRAFRLVRLVKFLRTFPEVTKQAKILADVMGSIMALLVLMLIMIFIFTIVGMNLLGGQMWGEWPAEDGILPGQEVYVQIPWDANGGQERHGKVHWTDFENHPRAPYKVEVEYGGKGGGSGYDPMVNRSLDGTLDEQGFIWAATQDEANIGTAIITKYTPRFHFDNLGVAFLTSFQVFTMANWNDDLYDVMGSTGSVVYSFYFYLNIVMGNWILFNLFIAILIGKFADQRKEALEENLEQMKINLMNKLGDLSDDMLGSKMQALFAEIDLDGSGEIDKYEFEKALQDLGVKLKPRELNELVKSVDEDGSGRISFAEFMAMIKNILNDAKVSIDNKALEAEVSKAQELQEEVMENMPQVGDEKKERLPVSCFCFQEENQFRQACIVLTNEDSSKYPGWKGQLGPFFNNFILACILISTVCLAIFTPWTGEDSKMTEMLDLIDILLNTAFTIELIAKFVAQGWTTFISSGWNKLDLFIVFTSDLDMTLTYALKGQDIPLSALRIFRVFRIFRALRPLRIIARARGVRLLVGTLASAVKPVSVTLAIAVGILFVLGIFFVQFLGGKMKNCSDPALFTKPLCQGLDDDGNPLSWGAGDVNFDNIWNALIAMFILSSQDDWPSHMFASIDGTGPLTGYKQGANSFMAPIFFIAALMITSAIVINMFVGVFVDCYFGTMNEVDGEDAKQKNPPLNPDLAKKILDDPPGKVRSTIYPVISSTKFDMFIAFFIVTNVLSMAFESFKPASWQQAFDAWSNFFFTFIFGWECVFKMFTLRPYRYFMSGWNKFDFFIVIVSFGGIFVDNAAGVIDIDASIMRILRIFRIFRILRAFRIFKSLKELQNIVLALGKSAGQVGNLGLLLFLVFFIFGVLGVNIGGHMCVDGDAEPPDSITEKHPLLGVRCAITSEGAQLERHGHFQGVGVALLTLWRVATSDAWGDIMNAVSLVPSERGLSKELEEVTQATLSMTVEEIKPTEMLDGALEKAGYQGEHLTSMAIATTALMQYKGTIESGEDGDGYLQLASIALPDCLMEDEANFFSEQGLMDCSNPGDGFSAGVKLCPGTCGFNFAGLFYSTMVSKIYFMVFVCVSQFVLLQLVIAVLMDQLNGASGEEAAKYEQVCPGCDELKVATMTRVYRRFHFNARRKLLAQKRKESGSTRSAESNIPHNANMS